MTIAKTEKPAPKLDWTRLLGFDQAEQSRDETGGSSLHDPRLVKLGAKCGEKTGFKLP